MDPVRRKIPAGVRALLTDITPKQEQHFSDWTEPETESVTRDGITLPIRGTSEALLMQAGGTDGGTADGNGAPTLKSCGLCLSKPSCYTCPRCNIPYCGLACYRSPDHSSCSEEFYKESVLQELKSRGVTDKEGIEKMRDILLKLRQSAESEGGMGNLFKNLEEETGTSVTDQDAHALELLSRLAEIQSAGDDKSQEAQEILTKLKDIQEGGDITGGNESDEEEVDLAERLDGLDVDSLSEEELWSLLSAQEREKFEGLVKGGGIGNLVSLWSPWWEHHEKETKALIEELQSENDKEMDNMDGKTDGQPKTSFQEDGIKQGTSHNVNTTREDLSLSEKEKEKEQNIKSTNERKKHKPQNTKTEAATKQELNKKKEPKKKKKQAVPPISAKIPPLHTLSSNPSPLVRYNLVNALYGYTFSLCLFNGDISEPEMMLEFCQAVLSISEALGGGRVFSSVPEALEAGILAVSAGGHFDSGDPLAPLRAVEAVAHVLTGESREDAVGYSLSALSQLRAALNKAKTSVPKEEEQARRVYFQAGKKCEFFQSWVKENAEAVRSSAGWVWRDYERREVERVKLEREKKGLEEGLNKSRSKSVLIEEI